MQEGAVDMFHALLRVMSLLGGLWRLRESKSGKDKTLWRKGRLERLEFA